MPQYNPYLPIRSPEIARKRLQDAWEFSRNESDREQGIKPDISLYRAEFRNLIRLAAAADNAQRPK